jgi:hypothetical protein
VGIVGKAIYQRAIVIEGRSRTEGASPNAGLSATIPKVMPSPASAGVTVSEVEPAGVFV